MAYNNNKYNKDKKSMDKSKFKYIPDIPPAPFDTSFHTLNADGTYNYEGKFTWKLVESIEELKEFGKKCKDIMVAWDTETTGLAYFDDKIVGFSLSIDSSSGIYVPIRHEVRQLEIREEAVLDEEGNVVKLKSGINKIKKVKEYKCTEHEANLNPKEALDVLYDILLSAKIILCHNAEFDMIMLKAEGYDVDKIRFFDTLTLTYTIDAEARGVASLKGGEKHYLGRYRPDFKAVLGKEEDFRYIAPIDACFYASCDTASTYGLFEKLYPTVRKLIEGYKDTIVLGGKKYDVLKKDNRLIKCWIDYYAHTKLYVDKEIAIQYKKSIEEKLIDLKKEIYAYFNIGPFNLSTGANQFKDAMKAKGIVTGHTTEKGALSYGKEAIKLFNKNIKDLKVIIDNSKDISFNCSYLDFRSNVISLILSNILKVYGRGYFDITENNNNLKIFKCNGNTMTKEIFVEKLKEMYRNESSKLDILNKIQQNSSYTKAINSYIDKLTKVDSCRIRYKLLNTKSGRLSSGNGSKSDKKSKNTYYIDLNAQNLTKPGSAYYRAYKSEEQDNILGWKFDLVTDEYAQQNKETDYIVEGSSPELNIRNTIIAPEGKYVLSCDYASQEYILLALLSQDTKMLKNFKDGIDPHTATALAIWGKDKYNKEKRKLAKTVNFGVNYGGGAGTIAKNAEVPYEEACEILKAYEEAFFEAIQWKNNEISKMYRGRGVVYNIFGRPRKLGSYLRVADGLGEEDYRVANAIRSAANRRVTSHIIQGSCGDICRSVLIKLYDKIFKYPERELECSFNSAIHDEINVCVIKDKILDYAREVEDIMRFKLPKWQLPIVATIGIGNRLGQIFDFTWTTEERIKLIPKRVVSK